MPIVIDFSCWHWQTTRQNASVEVQAIAGQLRRYRALSFRSLGQPQRANKGGEGTGPNSLASDPTLSFAATSDDWPILWYSNLADIVLMDGLDSYWNLSQP